MKLYHIAEGEYDDLEDADEFGHLPPWATELENIAHNEDDPIILFANTTSAAGVTHDVIIFGDYRDLVHRAKFYPESELVNISDWLDRARADIRIYGNDQPQILHLDHDGTLMDLL